jgi:hypothetical protein
VGGGDGALADGFGVAGRHAQPVAGEGFAQRRPGAAKLLGGGVDAAKLFGKLEGAFGLGAVCEEPAGLPAHLPRQRGQAPLGEGGLAGVTVDAQLAGGLPQPDQLRSHRKARGPCTLPS